MRRLGAPLKLRELRIHPNGAVGQFSTRASLPSPGRWTLVLRGAPSALSAGTLEVEALGGRVLGAGVERFAEGRPEGLRQLWVELDAGAAGPVALRLEAGLGWASWRCASLCVQGPRRLDWSVWGEFWLQAALDPASAQLALSTRRLPAGPPPPVVEPAPGAVTDEVAALAATRGGQSIDPAAEPFESPRLLDPEPVDALGAHGVYRPPTWILGPDGAGRACLATASTPLPDDCVVRPGRDGRPQPRLLWQGPCPLPDGMPAGPLAVEAFGQRRSRSVRRWAPGSIRTLELGPDPRLKVRRDVRVAVEGPRQDVQLELEVRASRPLRIRCLEPTPRSVDPQLRVDLYALEPRDTAFDEGVLGFRAELGPDAVQTLSARFAVTCPTGHHPVRVPGGPE